MKLLIGRCKPLNGMLRIVEHGGQRIPTSSSMKLRRKKMIKKIKDKAIHYWANHKIESIVFIILVVALIVK